MTALNVNYIASTALQATYDMVPIQVYTFLGQTNTLGTITETYNEPISVMANMQLMTNQQLQHIEGYNQTKVYKNFWINNDQLTGLNRNITTGGDYLIWNSLVYKVIGVENNYLSYWVLLNTVESDVI